MAVDDNNVIDFQQYRDSKKIVKKTEDDLSHSDQLDHLDDISFVMEMSTDELISELACRLEFGKSMRDVRDDVLIDELMQRGSAIEFLLFTYIEKYSKEKT